MRKMRGITLISLVITIIVLIILAGVSINLTIGGNGILSKSKDAKQKYEIAEAKEYIEVKVDECIIEKNGNASLQDIVDYLSEDSNITYYVALEKIALVAGEIDVGSPKEIYVVYNRYQFKIEENKNVEFISIVDIDLEGQVTIEASVQEYLGKNEEGNYTVSVLLKAAGEAEISKLEIQNPDGTVLTLETDGLTTVGKDMTIEFDKEYKIILTTSKGHKYTKKIIEKSEETIMTAEELANFRDKVNSGLTYEGKTVKLGANIDLNNICYKIDGTISNDVSWEPINNFKGIFDGNYYKISNLYIYSDKYQYAGLFSKVNKDVIIKNIIMENEKINNIYDEIDTSTCSGGIAGFSDGIIQNCGINSGIIVSTKETITSSQSTYPMTMSAGIVAKLETNGEIYNCYNKANIIAEGVQYNVYNQSMAAGISALVYGKILNCYNIGVIEGKGHIAAGGIAGQIELKKEEDFNNCYNLAEIHVSTGNVSGIIGYSAGLIGHVMWLKPTENNYCTLDTSYSMVYYTNSRDMYIETNRIEKENLKNYADVLGESFIDDIQNEDGAWKYNDGYPILKWQLENN